MKKLTIIAALLAGITPMLASSASDLAEQDPFKEQDPFGWKMAIISMGVVFCALLILFICFKYGYSSLAALGLMIKKSIHRKAQLQQLVSRRAKKNKGNEGAIKVTEVETGKTVDDEELVAAIGVALFMHEDGMHDQESNVLTLTSTASPWTGAGNNLKKSPIRRF